MERLSKMEFFQKLGYNREDVVRVLGKLGDDALVNDVLQELIQTGSRPGTQQGPASSAGPLLVSRGSCGLPDSAQGSLGPALEEDCGDAASSLRPIVIDGSNVAMSHGNKEAFSCRGIQLAVDWFRDRGHTYIKVFVPSWRKEPSRSDTPIREQHVLEALERQGVLVYTPSRKVNGKWVVCYDDRYIVKLAYEQDGIIVSNDNYRDLQSENPEWKWFIEQRLLMFSFVNDRFMPPDDPLGRRGPTLSNFLSRRPRPSGPSWQHCPYGKKCTYGIKCKFYHPERPHHKQLAVADELRAKTLAWPGRGSGTEEPRPPSARAGSTAQPVPGAHSLQPAPRPGALEALRSSFSRLACSDDPACSLASRPRGPEWVPGASSPSHAGSAATLGPPCRGARGPRLHDLPSLPSLQPGHLHGDQPPQRRPPDDPWAGQPGSDHCQGRSAWAEPTWGEGTFGGPAGYATGGADRETDARAQARTVLCGIFPPDQVDSLMALFPAASDLARIILLLQRSQSAAVQLGKP